MGRAATGLAALPSRARVLFLACALVGLGTVTAALALLSPVTLPAGALALGLVLAAAALQLGSITLAWRGRRIAIAPDEAVFLIAFGLLDAPLVVLSATAAAILSQLALRRAPVKAAFNASVHAIAAGLAALVVVALRHASAGGVDATLLVPLVMSATGQSLVAGMLSLLAGRREAPLRTLARSELATSILVAAITGTTLGVLLIATWRWNPLATLALVPVAFFLLRAVRHEYRRVNELSTRRALAAASEGLGPSASEEAIVHAARDACREVIDHVEGRVELAPAAGVTRTFPWRNADATAAEGTSPSPRSVLEAPLVAAGGATLGRVVLETAPRSRAKLDDDRELLALVASHVSLALANARAEEARERAARLESLGTLIAGIAHEINNPVMYATGNLEMIELDLEDGLTLDADDVRKRVAAARRGLARIGSISTSLADVTTSQATERTDVDVRDLVAGAAQDAQNAAPAERARVTVEGGPVPLPILGASVDLRRALRAIIDNAIEAAGPSGRVMVDARAVGDASVEVLVADDGPGIPPEVRARLFTPFFTTQPERSGLGLAIARRIVTDHGGDIVVDDPAPGTPQGGARVRMRLPLARARESH